MKYFFLVLLFFNFYCKGQGSYNLLGNKIIIVDTIQINDAIEMWFIDKNESPSIVTSFDSLKFFKNYNNIYDAYNNNGLLYINCYHLRDFIWLKANDNSFSNKEESQFINHFINYCDTQKTSLKRIDSVYSYDKNIKYIKFETRTFLYFLIDVKLYKLYKSSCECEHKIIVNNGYIKAAIPIPQN
jgi:hypothetical protein